MKILEAASRIINKHTLALIDTVMMMIGKLVKWLSHDPGERSPQADPDRSGR